MKKAQNKKAKKKIVRNFFLFCLFDSFCSRSSKPPCNITLMRVVVVVNFPFLFHSFFCEWIARKAIENIFWRETSIESCENKLEKILIGNFSIFFSKISFSPQKTWNFLKNKKCNLILQHFYSKKKCTRCTNFSTLSITSIAVL